MQGLPPAATALLEQAARTRSYPKGAHILRVGETCRNSYIILSGIARKFTVVGDKEVTTDFYFPQDVAVSFRSYISQQPGTEAIECLTPVTVSVLEYAAFQAAKQQYPELLALDLLLTELYAAWLEERLEDQYRLSAAARYAKLLQQSPHLLQHIQLSHIASFLGISQATLSRIRAAHT